VFDVWADPSFNGKILFGVESDIKKPKAGRIKIMKIRKAGTVRWHEKPTFFKVFFSFFEVAITFTPLLNSI